MKFTLLAIAFAFCLTSHAQNFPPIELGEQAVFMHCIKEADPVLCTEETFKNLITKLITPQIIEEIKNSPEKDGFYISVIFLTDEQGKVIKENTEIVCANNALHMAIRNIISRLPAFYPKSDKMAIRKSAHLFNLKFVPDSDNQNYVPVERVSFLDKTPELLTYDQYARYKNCKDENENAFVRFPCLANPIQKFVLKNFKVPQSELPGHYRVMVYFTVTTTGEITLSKIMEGTEGLRAEIAKQFKALPKAEPALIKGVPTIQSFVIPFTINVD